MAPAAPTRPPVKREGGGLALWPLGYDPADPPTQPINRPPTGRGACPAPTPRLPGAAHPLLGSVYRHGHAPRRSVQTYVFPSGRAPQNQQGSQLLSPGGFRRVPGRIRPPGGLDLPGQTTAPGRLAPKQSSPAQASGLPFVLVASPDSPLFSPGSTCPRWAARVAGSYLCQFR